MKCLKGTRVKIVFNDCRTVSKPVTAVTAETVTEICQVRKTSCRPWHRTRFGTKKECQIWHDSDLRMMKNHNQSSIRNGSKIRRNFWREYNRTFDYQRDLRLPILKSTKPRDNVAIFFTRSPCSVQFKQNFVQTIHDLPEWDQFPRSNEDK